MCDSIHPALSPFGQGLLHMASGFVGVSVWPRRLVPHVAVARKLRAESERWEMLRCSAAGFQEYVSNEVAKGARRRHKVGRRGHLP